MYWIEAAILATAFTAVGTIISWATVRAFAIKYSDSKHNQKLHERLEQIEATMRSLKADQIAELEAKVKGLELDFKTVKNIGSLSARARV